MTERKSQGKLPLDKTVEAFDLYRDLIAWRGDLPEIDTSLARMAVEARQAAIEAYKDPEQSTDRNHPKNRAAKETIKAFYDMITQGGGQRPAPSGSAVGSPP